MSSPQSCIAEGQLDSRGLDDCKLEVIPIEVGTNKAEAVVLIMTDHYLPGYKAGGPIRTLANVVEQLEREFRFKVITKDRDFGDRVPYRELSADVWTRLGNAEVRYLSPSSQSFAGLRHLLHLIRYDVLYLNSFFSASLTIKPLVLRRLGLIPSRPVIVAPRGEFSPSALKLKRSKKRLYVSMAKGLNLYSRVTWQASTQHEAADIRREFDPDGDIVIAPDLVAQSPLSDGHVRAPAKTGGAIDVVFLARIARMKNLSGALKILNGVKGLVNFHIYGPREDVGYWDECGQLLQDLPDNITVECHDAVRPEEVHGVLGRHHLLLLPTLGENFGHVIFESLSVGCPVLISDRTPWRGLEGKGVGWDLRLDNLEGFQTALQRCVDMGEEEYTRLSQRARDYATQYRADASALDAYRTLFRCKDA